MKAKTIKPTKAQLQRKILELESQLAFGYRSACTDIDKASDKHMMASGVLLQLTALGGREIIRPVVIRDGLSSETIEAIKKDLVRSYDLTVMFKPVIK
jgi:hypothetical protein